MHDHASWSLNLGRWAGVQVRLHMSFLLLAAFAFYFSWRGDPAGHASAVDWLVFQALAVLLASVVLHEIGHAWAAWRLGGQIEQIILGPLGGLARPRPTTELRCELLAYLAGPLANLLACFVLLPVLLPAGGVAGLVNPLAPEGLTVGSRFMVWAKLCFWINWSLALVNSLPVFPFDGARALKAGMLIRWPDIGRRLASYIVAKVAKFVALGVLLASFLLEFDNPVGLIPLRFVLLLLAILLFFSAQHEEQRSWLEEPDDDSLLGGGLASDLNGLERELQRSPANVSGPFESWLARRRRMRNERQRALEAEEERRVDEILARLHEHGPESLSPADRALLERVSARYRSRLHAGKGFG